MRRQYPDVGAKPYTHSPHITQTTRQGNQPQTGGLCPAEHLKVTRQGNQPQTGDLRPALDLKVHPGNQPQASDQHHAQFPEPDAKVYEISIDVQKRFLPHVLLETQVSKFPLTLLVDSGSAVSLLKITRLHKNIELHKESIKLRGFDTTHDDETTSTLGHLRVKLQISKDRYLNHKFHVINDIDFPYDGIIGNDLLSKFNCTIDYTTDTLTIKTTKVKLHFFEPFYIIPPRTETIIECSVQNPEIREGLIVDQHLSESLLVSNCLVKVKENKRINLSVLNVSEKPINLKSNLNLKLTPLNHSDFDKRPTVTVNHINQFNSNISIKRREEVLKQLRIAHLNYEERESLIQLCSDYSDIFHLPNENLTCTNALKHEIKTTSNIPIHTKTYRFPEVHKSEVHNQINKMLEQNIIEPSSSPWSSPIWVVPKKLDASQTQKWRVVIDYRKLNDITIGDTYPIPQITEILDQLGCSKYFSTLDLASGFHQIKLNDADKEKTAFTVPEGHYHFLRMPFGLKNAPSTFQRLMNSALSGLQGIRCFVYLDDVVCYSHDLDTHIINLKSIFQRMRDFNLKLQPEKCEFLRREVAYLGHIISEDGVKPNPDKIKAVTMFPIPQTPKDVKSFLGLVSYYRRFISDFSKTAKPLTSLLKKDQPFLWENQQQLAFEELKSKLTSAPVLCYPDFTKPFLLTTDASNHALGAVLSQGPLGKERPVAYASRTLNKSECNYSTTEKELLAILYGCKTFRPYLYGQKFQIITDHRPLKWLFNHKDPSSKMQRWRLKLEEYDYEILYRKGKLNSAADALSRYPVNPVYPKNPEQAIPPTDNNTAEDLDRDLLDLLVTPPSFQIEDLSPPPDLLELEYPNATELTLNQNLPEVVLDPQPSTSLGIPEMLPVPANPNLEHLEMPSDVLPESIQSVPENTSSISENVADSTYPNPDPALTPEDLPSLDDTYKDFLKSDTKSCNTYIVEHNENLLKGTQRLIVIPTSVDMDESMPYTQEVLDNCPNTERDEFLKLERELYTCLPLTVENKIYLFLFTKVFHFDDHSYPDIFKSLKYARDEIIMSYPSICEISISDFRNPFDKHSFVKIYNMLNYLFDGTNINVHIYHNKIIYPSITEIPKILQENHDIPIAGHLGSTRMYGRIKERYYWKNMRSDIETYVKNCRSCQTNKALRKINRAPMIITSTSTSPFERLAIDVVGPLPEAGNEKYKFILTMQDDLTKFSVAYPLRNITAGETSECLVHFISLFGIPKHILTDQGTNFTADLFKKTCEFLKIKQLWASPYHPQTQGALERSHSTLKEYLKSYVNDNQDNWPRYVFTSMLAYNTSVHSTTHYSPYELLFGHKPHIPDSIYNETSTSTYPEYVRMLQHRMKLTRDKALEFVQKSKLNSKNYYDTHTRSVQYKVGDYVFLKNHLRLRKALSPIWKGPYKVVKVHGNHTLSLLINRRHVKHHYDEVKLAKSYDVSNS